MENKIPKKIFSSVFVSLIILASILFSIGMISAATAINLGAAESFAILSKTGIMNTGGITTSVVGDMGVSPIGYAAITGFTLSPIVPDGSNTFATSLLVTNGKIYASDYTEPTPTNLGIAVLDMQAAYLAGLEPVTPAGVGATNLDVGAGTLSGNTFVPGVYTWGTGVTMTNDITLDAQGDPNAVWIFQIAGTLDIASGKHIILSPDAQAKNIFWVVAGQVTLGTDSVFNGNILAQTSIALQTGATLNGRALAQAAVTLAATVTIPEGASSRTLTGIAVATPATKLTYTIGDSLDITGLTITKTYSDSSTQIMTPTLSQVTNFNSSTPVTGQVLTITYGSQTTSYTIDVSAAPTTNTPPPSGGGGSPICVNCHFNTTPTATTPVTTTVAPVQTTPQTTTPTETTQTTPSTPTTSGITGGVIGSGTAGKIGLIVLGGLILIVAIALLANLASSKRKMRKTK